MQVFPSNAQNLSESTFSLPLEQDDCKENVIFKNMAFWVNLLMFHIVKITFGMIETDTR